jgi:2-polyprenyl-3-methyl-5-hydroxy-6-metoxy-1,4-benzoquinol methylase
MSIGSPGLLSCRICNGTLIAPLFIKQKVSYFQCKNCQFIFSDSRNPNLTNELQDFEPAYLDYLKEKNTDIKNHRFILDQLGKHQDLTGKTFLDIGCGSGKLVKFLNANGFEAIGIEPSTALFESFLQQGHSFFKGDVIDFALSNQGRQFDIIIASDVLEHVEDPDRFFEEIEKLLSPGGLLFISTPDAGSFFARVSGKRWHYYNKYHLSIFSRSNIARLANKNKLSVISSGTVTRYHSLYYITKYALNFVFLMDMRVPHFLSRFSLPMNLFDNMYLVCAK